MRIWDINPGYLNRQSLLGEHRELHGIVSILANGKKGYSNHPETRRWIDHGWALRQRHAQLAAEMALRGYLDASPVTLRSGEGLWPDHYIDTPMAQFAILAEKYREKGAGRIPLPQNAQQLWAQHKYSVMARDVPLYNRLGREVAGMRPGDDFSVLARMLSEELRQPPSPGGVRNALQHMWGYLSEGGVDTGSWPLQRLLRETQRRAMAGDVAYLVASTALGELGAWVSEWSHSAHAAAANSASALEL